MLQKKDSIAATHAVAAAAAPGAFPGQIHLLLLLLLHLLLLLLEQGPGCQHLAPIICVLLQMSQMRNMPQLHLLLMQCNLLPGT